MTFSSLNLNPKIYQAIEQCGYTTPTEIQQKSIPLILKGKDVIGATETGSGKTAAFVLPALHLIAEGAHNPKPRVLILTPTRELASQISGAATKYGKFIKLRIASLIGGVSYYHQERALSQPLDIVIATPGRLMDHMRKKRLDLSHIEMFILDEADRMLDMGFIDDVKLIAKSLPAAKQTLLFTATLDRRLNKTISEVLNDPISVDLTKELMVPDQIKQQIFMANNTQQKTEFLENLMEKNSVFKGIIFSATKINVDRLAHQLKSNGHRVLPLHGDLNQSVRKRTLDQLRDGKIQYIVATDVVARGIDIHDISHVVHYDLPRSLEDYVHRSGRTGRAGRSGESISLVTRDDRELLFRIERFIGKRLQHIDFDGTDCATPEPERPEFRKGRSNAGGGFKKKFGASNRSGRDGGRDSRSDFRNSDRPSSFKSRSRDDAPSQGVGFRSRSRDDMPRQDAGPRARNRDDMPRQDAGPRARNRDDMPRQSAGPRARNRDDMPRQSAGPRARNRDDMPRQSAGPRDRNRDDMPRQSAGPRDRNRDDMPRQSAGPRARNRDDMPRHSAGPRARNRDDMPRHSAGPRDRNRDDMPRQSAGPRARNRDDMPRQGAGPRARNRDDAPRQDTDSRFRGGDSDKRRYGAAAKPGKSSDKPRYAGSSNDGSPAKRRFNDKPKRAQTPRSADRNKLSLKK